MRTGRVTYYTEDRGFGFIKPDDGGVDVFVHANHLVNTDLLKKDQRVSFEVVNDDRRGKPRADKVRVMDEDLCAALARAWPEESNAHYALPPLITAKF
jgi:cold shock protein